MRICLKVWVGKTDSILCSKPAVAGEVILIATTAAASEEGRSVLELGEKVVVTELIGGFYKSHCGTSSTFFGS